VITCDPIARGSRVREADPHAAIEEDDAQRQRCDQPDEIRIVFRARVCRRRLVPLRFALQTWTRNEPADQDSNGQRRDREQRVREHG